MNRQTKTKIVDFLTTLKDDHVKAKKKVLSAEEKDKRVQQLLDILTPKKGQFILTRKEIVDIVTESIRGKIDGKDGKDGYTPIKGKDYFDGKNGENGGNGRNGENGKTPIKGEDYFTDADIKMVVDLAMTGFKIRSEQIVALLSDPSLTYEKRLSVLALKDLNKLNLGQGGGVPVDNGGGGSGTVSTITDLILEVTSGDIDGSNNIFTFASKPVVIVSRNVWYRENKGWTWDGGTLTATLDLPAVDDVYGLK